MAIDFKKCRETKSGNVVTPKARMSFPSLFTPRTPPGSDKAKYQLSLLIPADCDISLLKQAAQKAAKEKWGDKMPKQLKSPFLDAGDHEYEGYVAGMVLIRANSLQKPGVINAAGEHVTDESEVYPGRWCCASLRAFAYDTSGNRGVAFGLQNVQLLDHDEPIGGRSRAEDDFEPVPVEGGTKEDAGSLFDAKDKPATGGGQSIFG